MHDPFTASATLVDPVDGVPIADKLITFTLGLGDSCSYTTDASGIASCPITPTQAAATYPLVASFNGDVDYVSSSDSASFVITREETTTTYTGRDPQRRLGPRRPSVWIAVRSFWLIARTSAGLARHFGLVLDEEEAVRARMEELGVRVFGRLGLDFYDSWGNLIQVVDCHDVQFTTDAVLRTQGLKGLKKSERAREELRAKGISTR